MSSSWPAGRSAGKRPGVHGSAQRTGAGTYTRGRYLVTPASGQNVPERDLRERRGVRSRRPSSVAEGVRGVARRSRRREPGAQRREATRHRAGGSRDPRALMRTRLPVYASARHDHCADPRRKDDFGAFGRNAPLRRCRDLKAFGEEPTVSRESTAAAGSTGAHFRTRSPVVALSLALALACSSTSEGPTPPSEAEIGAFIDRLCNAAAPCCTSIGTTASPDSCKTLFGQVGPNLIPDVGEACLAEIGTSDGGQCFRFGQYPSDPCFRMFTGRYGTAGPGEACTKDSDCSAPPGGTSKCFGKGCQWQLPGKPGDTPCVGTSANGVTLYYGDGSDHSGYLCDAQDGVFCDISARPWTCRAFRQPGEPCIQSRDCASGICSGECTDSPCNDVCLAATPLGQSCDTRGCAPGTFCDRTTMPNTCVTLLPPGSPCGDNDQCTTDNCSQSRCSAITLAQQLIGDQLCGHLL